MKSITAEELIDSIRAELELILIDVRQPEELLHGTIVGAYNFPLSDMPNRIEELEELISSQGRERKVVIFCRSGGRSTQVIAVLEKRLPVELYNLVGGMKSFLQLDK